MPEFYHLHTHSQYSLNDAMIRPKQLAKKLKELGMKKYAITEHGVMMNMPEFYQELKKEGIELIVGMETYVAPRGRMSKEGRYDMSNHHLVLLCENNKGYDNLKYIASDAALNGFYNKPRTDRDVLREHHEGLIGMSACLGGSINQALLENRYDDAKKDALEYLDIFGKGNFFLEIQRHNLADQDRINPEIIRLSKETGIPLVATNDNHYLNPEDWEAHDILMAIQAKTTINDSKRKVYTSREFYVKSQAEMVKLFSDIPEAISNTVEIANRCHVEIEFGVNKIPPFKLPKSFSGDGYEYLKSIVYDGAKRLYRVNSSQNIMDKKTVSTVNIAGEEVQLEQIVIDKIEYELNVIKNMGYVNYFLITWDFFRFCKYGTYEIDDEPSPDWEPILVGPGRGSGAGSVVLYCTGVTKINPIEYNLLFERFLDPSRISMPDIDSDFESTRRQEVIDYVVYKYGRNNISQVITYGSLAARASIRAVGRALDLPYSLCDKVAKMIPSELGITIDKALGINKDLNSLCIANKDVEKLISMAMKLEGLPTSTSTHAAGVLITDDRGGESYGVTEHVPMWKNDSGIVAQYDKNILESLGLLKMDFLGLTTLGVIGQAKRFIKQNHGVDIDLDEIFKIPTLEPLKLIREGKTIGIFQLESPGMTNFMKELQPQSIEDIIAGISLYRPGPMNEIPRFLYNKRNPDKVRYPVDGATKEILEETYGVLVYQEQCMRAVIAIAGYDKSDSDGYRKVIAKKIQSKMPLHRKWFIYGRKEEDYNEDGKLVKYNPIPGGVALKHNESSLVSFFELMVDFAKYAFNKSHAACYAFVGYATAWLIYYYPTEYMAALLNSVMDNREKLSRYISYCKRIMNIEILEPDINVSSSYFVPLDGGKIMCTLSVKGAGKNAISGIIKEREKAPYKNLMDFILRTRGFLDKSTYEALISVGAFNGFNIVKSQHLAALEDFWDGALKKVKDSEKRYKKSNKPFDFENTLNEKMNGIFPDINEFPDDTILRLEKEFLGIYLTGNPLHKYAYAIKTKSNFSLEDIEYDIDNETGAITLVNSNLRDNQKIKFVAMVNEVYELTTKKKDLMCRIEIEDLTGVGSALIWPRDYSFIKNAIEKNNIYMCEGYLQVSSDEAPNVIINRMEQMEDVVVERIIYQVDSVTDGDKVVKMIKDTRLSQGSTPFYLSFNNNHVLLSKEYWANKEYFKKHYSDKIKLITW